MIVPLQIGFSLEKTAALHFGRKWPKAAIPECLLSRRC